MSRFKKIIASILVFLVLLTTTTSPVLAGPWYSQDFFEWHKKVYSGEPNQIFGERYTSAQVRWVFYGLLTIPISFALDPTGGIEGNEWLNCAQNANVLDPATMLDECWKIVSNLFASSDTDPTIAFDSRSIFEKILTERPISAVTYFSDIGRKIQLVPEVQAQTGFGFQALNPVLELWKVSRNITYIFFIIVMIALSFMVMFKVKLNPQTSITIQSAIPKVVIAMILVTFSYAIAGLLIDIMYVFIGLISTALASTGILNANVPGATGMFDVLTKGPKGFGLLGFIDKFWGLFTITSIWVGVAGGTQPDANFFASAGLLILGLLMLVVGTLVMIYIWIKITWMLFKTLANIFLSTIFAPFQILLGVIMPNAGFGQWIRGYISNLAVFPIVSLMFLLAEVFLAMATTVVFGKTPFYLSLVDWIPFGSKIYEPFATYSTDWPPLLGTGPRSGSIIFLGTSFVIITIIPKTVELIQSIIKGGQFNYGAAINEATGAPINLAKGGMSYYAAKTEESDSQDAGRQVKLPWAQFLRTIGQIK